MKGTVEVVSLEVFYPAGRKLPEWEAAHRLGAVPDRWPYGLNRMGSDSELSIQGVEAQPLRPVGLASAVLRGGGPRKSRDRHRTAIAWDEDLALRLAVERANSIRLAGVIWCTDRIYSRQRTAKDALLRRILPSFSGLWTLSRGQVDVLDDWLGRSAPPIEFLRFGIDHEFFSRAGYPEKPFVLSIGRDRDRDPDTLFDALEEIKRLKPEARVAVQTTSEKPAPVGIETLPMLSHSALRDYYRRASVVLVATKPNLHVSGMTVALESMATARPVVITSTPGMDDYVEDGVSGLLCTPGDSQGMADAVLSLLDDPVAAERMGRMGREVVENRHTTEQMAERLRGIILNRAI